MARRANPAARRLLAGTAAGLALTLVWILNATTVRELLGHVEARTFGGAFDLAEFAGQQASFTVGGMTLVGIAVALPATAYALSRRSARPAIIVVLIAGAIVVATLNQAAFTRSFFALPFVTVLAIGIGVSAETLAARFPLASRVLPGVLLMSALVMFASFVIAEAPYDGSERAADAAQVLEHTQKPAGVDLLYVDREILAPRWAAWQWNVPVAPYTGAESAQVILVRSPVDSSLAARTHQLAREGDYVLLSTSR
jgi:hypothetical protein